MRIPNPCTLNLFTEPSVNSNIDINVIKINHVHFKIGLSTYNSVITRMHSDFEALIIVHAPFGSFEIPAHK
jgi:hypothetical protein